MEKKYILDKEGAARKMRRMAYEIYENNMDESSIILAGVKGSGTVVAACIKEHLAAICGIQTELLTVTLDKKNPSTVTVDKQIELNDKVIILVDDVANSGKTLLYALKPFLEFHPKKIQILALVERSHKAFPVHPDYTGLSIATTLDEHIYVETEGNEVKGAWVD
jgi:pyrimidine operon attenuation protein / uracil phosphoribosyltransferase